MSILTAAISVGERPWVLATLELIFKLLFDNLWIETHLFKEAVNHVLPTVTFAVMAVMSMVTMAVTVVLLLLFSLSWLSFFIENGNHDSGCTTSFFNLQKGMIVIEFFFAVCAVVEVFADSALVTDSYDGRFTTTITRNTNVSDNLFSYWLFGLFSFGDLEADAFVFK